MKHTQIQMDPATGILILILAVVWGGSFFLAEVALTAMPPLTVTLFRVGLAVPVLVLVVWAKGIRVPRSLRVWGAYLVMGCLNNALPFSLIFWGQTQIESGLASILNGTTAMAGAVAAGLFLADERLTANRLIGAVIGLGGVAVIMGPDALSGFDASNLGQLAVLGAACSYALASVWARKRLAGQPALMNALGMLVSSTSLMIPVVFWVDGIPSLDLPGTVWIAMLALATVSTAFAYQLYFAILPKAGAANLMLVTLLIPPIAIGLGALFLNERLTLEAWIGFGIIAIGLLVTDGRLLRRWSGR